MLYYPGATASQMLRRLQSDPKFAVLKSKKDNVKQIFILVGTNNVNGLCNGSVSFKSVENDISRLLYELWATFGNARLNVLNVLPRESRAKHNTVQQLNHVIKNNICHVHGLNFIDTDCNNKNYFTDKNGLRKNECFSLGYDNVHLSSQGYSILAKYLKYLAHT